MTGKFAIVTAAGVALLACTTATSSCGCTPHIFQPHFVGFVTNATGPVTDARGTASVFAEDCQATASTVLYLAPTAAVGDSAGHYRLP